MVRSELVSPQQPIQLLRLINDVQYTAAPYYQFTCPMLDEQKITLGVLFKTREGIDKRLNYFVANGKFYQFLSNIIKLLKKEKYDIVHVHTVHTGVLFMLAALVSRPSILRQSLMTLHTSYNILKFRNKVMFFLTLMGFQKIICCSRSSFESLPTFIRFLGGRRLTFIPNGLDLSRVEKVRQSLPPALEVSNRNFSVVSVGHLITGKNPHTVLRAFAKSRIPGATLTFIGAGPLEESLRAEVRQLECAEQVRLVGLIPREEVFKYLLQADLFVSASRGEGLPVAVIEAMACGCCVILSDIPPHREVGEGLDFLPYIGCDDVDGLARAMTAIAQARPEQRRILGEKGRKHCETVFSLDRMMTAYKKVFEELKVNNPF